MKINRFNFLTCKCTCESKNCISAINLKLFGNHGGIFRFRKKFKKDSGEINPLGDHRNMRGCFKLIVKDYGGNQQYFCLRFC